MAQIKPGMLCWLTHSDFDPSWIGRVVTAERENHDFVRNPSGDLVLARGIWDISAPWLPPNGIGWASPVECLRPITDPDADLTETQDMQDNLLAVLPYTRSTDPAGESLLEGEMA